MPAPSTGFDLGYLIQQGEIEVDDPVSRHFPESMNVVMSALMATVTFEGEEGDSYTIDWGDGRRDSIVSSVDEVTHEYLAPDDYEICLYSYGTKNWELRESVTAEPPV